MQLTEKEISLLQDLKREETLCVEKYRKYSGEACDGTLKNLFSEIGKMESGHVATITTLLAGEIPTMQGGGGGATSGTGTSACDAATKQKDAYLCADALATEKHVSAVYDTCIFEFKCPQRRNILNHIQTEEQGHGEKLYNYMAQNGIYE